MLTSDLDFDLPNDRIATAAAEPRDAAKLLVIRRAAAPNLPTIEHRHVRDLALPDAKLLRQGDLLVFNQSRVLPANFKGIRTDTGGKVSGLFLTGENATQAPCHKDSKANTETTNGEANSTWRVMLESRGKLLPNETITLTNSDGSPLDSHSTHAAQLKLIERLGEGAWKVAYTGQTDTIDLLHQIGTTPLPPYIRAERKKNDQPEVTSADQQRYNTVYAHSPGSVAAPTAGLHFTDELLDDLRKQEVQTAFVTLHVGLGTFAPVRVDDLDQHDIHHEWIQVPAATIAAMQQARQEGRRIIPVGTTTVRALESLPSQITPKLEREGYTTDTNLFITPGTLDTATNQPTPWPFRFTDCLMTNFHLPKSTLLALVAALPDVGIDQLKQWYNEAIANDYRFYSYGDAMLLV